MSRVQKSEMTRKPSKRGPSSADLLLWEQLQELSEPLLEIYREASFCTGRRWRFDFAVIEKRPNRKIIWIGIEIEGGVWIRGRHNRGTGFLNDMAKYNEAARLGWMVLRFSPDQVLKGEAIDFIKRVLAER